MGPDMKSSFMKAIYGDISNLLLGKFILLRIELCELKHWRIICLISTYDITLELHDSKRHDKSAEKLVSAFRITSIVTSSRYNVNKGSGHKRLTTEPRTNSQLELPSTVSIFTSTLSSKTNLQSFKKINY